MKSFMWCMKCSVKLHLTVPHATIRSGLKQSLMHRCATCATALRGPLGIEAYMQ